MTSHATFSRRIQNVSGADGVRLAYWTVGSGNPPLVYLASGPWTHVELWEVEECRRWYRQLAAGRTLVGYDLRGTGASQRDVEDFSFEAQLRNLEAVVDGLGLERFDLFAAADAGALGVAYAAMHPDRISRLILWCAWTQGADLARSPRVRAWRTLLEQDWDLFTDTCAQLALGWSTGEAARRSAERLRESITPEVFRAAFAAADSTDVSSLLPRVRSRTLVLHRRDITWLPADTADRIASELPDAELVFLDGDSTAPYSGDTTALLSLIERFLSDAPSTAGRALRSDPHAALVARSDGLTGREIEVLRQVGVGRTNQEIADELVVSLRTVEHHLTNIYSKTGLRRKAEATAYALKNGLV